MKTKHPIYRYIDTTISTAKYRCIDTLPFTVYNTSVYGLQFASYSLVSNFVYIQSKSWKTLECICCCRLRVVIWYGFVVVFCNAC